MDDIAYLEISAQDGNTFKAYIAMPEAETGPAVIVIQEIFGINQEMRDKCDALAAQGYIAICPDLFWRIEPGIELSDSNEEELQRAFELFEQFDAEQGLEDLKATLAFAEGFGAKKVGCIGYCLGGKLAYMMAAETKVDVSISYYGVGLEDMLKSARKIKNPLMLHIAEADEFVPEQAQKNIKLVLAKFQHIDIHSYPGLPHAFARTGGAHYNKMAAMLANKRTAEFLTRNLGQAKAA